MALPRPQPKTQTNGSESDNNNSRPLPPRSRVQTKAPAFVRASTATKHRLILNIQGPEKTGKDHMALTFSGGPIYVHSFDQGLEGVVQKFQATREIYVAEYELTIQPGEATDKEVGEAANIVWEQFVSNYRDSLASTRDEGLVMVDTATEAWELLRLASFGKLTQVLPHHYSKPNAEFRDLVRESYDASNMVLLSKMKDEWENYLDSKGQEKSRRTGNKKAMTMNDVPFLVQSNVQTFSEEIDGGGTSFYATILDNRLNPDLRGLTIDNDFNVLLDLTFAAL
jgi:hypothetical protein